MTSKTIYLIRHGETDYNLKGIVQGSGVDTDLNETGLRQAKAFYESYKEIPFKKVYTSSLKRAVQSVQQFIDAGIPHESFSGLNEISWGDKDGKIVNNEDHNYYRQVLDCWSRGEVDKCIEGGESPVDVQKRQKPVIDLIASRDEDPVLICMHGRAMRILLASILHQDLRCMDQFEHHNLCLYVIKYFDRKFVMEKCNGLEHLQLNGSER